MENSNKKRVVLVTTIIVFVLFLGYIYYQSREFFSGPRITITEPSELSQKVTDELLKVSGKAENISSLKLNGGEISVDQYNSFSESLLLAPGFNIIEIEAEDRFGHVRTEIRNVVYEPKPEKEQEQRATTTEEMEQASTSEPIAQ